MRCKHRRLRIAIPTDALSAHPSLREKTMVAGYIARAAAALRAEAIDIYVTKSTAGADVLEAILRYLSEPVYLRKKLFPLSSELRYVGILPPVTIEAAHEGFKDREDGLFFKLALVEKCLKGSRAVVDAGFEDGIVVKLRNCRKGSIILVGFDDKNKPVKTYPRRYGIWRGHYLGFAVKMFNDIYELLEFYKRERLIRIGTSKRGEWPGKLREFVGKDVAFIFGSPSEGLLDRYGELDLDAIVNILPCQGIKTIRLEEAVWVLAGLYSSLEFGL